MTEQEKKQYEYVIGIDLGHGETSAALCPLQWDTTIEMLDPAKDLEMGGNKKVIPSAITILENGNAYIGDAAFNPEVLKQAKVRVCFKKAPQDINGESEQLMIRFMKEVYRRIREQNPATLTDRNHLVYIATPSGWDESTQQLYMQMAQQAGIPIAGITKESRAAFVRAQHDTTSGLGRNIEKGAIVFDMGSSTLDFTYMNKDLPKLIDHGYDCGASFVEKSVYAREKDREDCIQLFEKKYPDLSDYLVFETRKVKEQVYFDPTLRVKKTINFDDIIDDEELEDERFRLVFSPGDLNEFLKDNGYLQEIREAMVDYKSNHIPGQNIYGVFMTGGASRMDFLKPLICECWGVTEDKIYRDQDPSLTISQGVAELARADLRSSGKDTEIGKDIAQLKHSDAIYEDFIQNFGGAIYESVVGKVADSVTDFANSSSDKSLNQLQNSISSAVRNGIDSVSSDAPRYIQELITAHTEDIRKKVDSIVANYTSQGSNIQIPTLSIDKVNVSGINLNDVMKEISNQITEQSNKWSDVITGAAIGGGIGLLLGGPLAWMVGGAYLIGKKFFGESEEEKKRKAMQKPLDAGQRLEVYNSIDSKWGEITDNIASSIVNSLRSNQKIRQSVKKAVDGLLNAYEESLRSSRILID